MPARIANIKTFLVTLLNPDALESLRTEAVEQLIEGPARWAALSVAPDDLDMQEECAQAARAKLYFTLADGKWDPSKGEFSAWACNVARNEALDTVTEANRFVSFEDLDEDDPDLIDLWGPSEDDILENIDVHRLFSHAVDAAHLTDSQIEVLQMYYGFGGLEKMTEREIAAGLGIEKKSVHMLRKRAEVKLKVTLQRLGAE